MPRRTILAALLLAGAVVQQPDARAASFDCLMNPSTTLKIGSPVPTTLATVDVERGQHVARGQIIARLESAAEAADVALDEARANSTAEILSQSARVDFAKSEVGRAEQLLENSNVARQKVEELRTNLRVAQGELQLAVNNHQIAELDLARARAMLERRIIRSPIDGVVVQRLLGPGEYAHQDAAIVELAAVDPLNVEAYPPARYFSAIRVDMTGSVQPEAPADRAYSAKVTIVDPVFDASSGTFGVRLTLPNPDGRLPAGLRCRVTIETPGEPNAPTR